MNHKVDERLALIQDGVFDVESIDGMMEDVQDRVSAYEEQLEEIITTAMNVNVVNETIKKEIDELTKLVDNLRGYEKLISQLRKKVREVSDFLWS